MDLIVVVDTSGSMNEMGKIQLQRNLLRYAVQWKEFAREKYKDLNLRLYQWDQTISEISVQVDGDIPALIAKGSSSLSDLSDFLYQHLKGSEIKKILILTDGNFHSSDIESFQKRLDICTNFIIRTVAVGADADLLKLTKISTNNKFYLAENIASAIDGTIFGCDKPFNAPVSAVQIMQSPISETEEPEEDWDA